MKTSNYVRITVPADMCYGKMSNEAVAAAVARRISNASATNEYARKAIVALMVALAVGVGALISSFAAQKNAPAESAPEVKTIVVYKEGIGAWSITEEERADILTAVMSSARGESELAMQAVAQSIRCASADYGITIGEVLDEFHYPMNYTGTPSDECIQAVADVFDNGIMAVNMTVHSFYNPDVQSGAWHEAQTPVFTMGNLKFFA